MAHAGGRPPKYKTAEEMQIAIDRYFTQCDPHWIDEEYWDYPYLETRESLEEQGHGGALKRTRKQDFSADMVQMTRKRLTDQQPYTMADLAICLGMERHTLMIYKGSDKFSTIIKAARSKVGAYNERMLHQGKNVAGAIFNLKVNFDYHEKIEENPPPDNPIVFINNVPAPPNEKDV